MNYGEPVRERPKSIRFICDECIKQSVCVHVVHMKRFIDDSEELRIAIEAPFEVNIACREFYGRRQER